MSYHQALHTSIFFINFYVDERLIHSIVIQPPQQGYQEKYTQPQQQQVLPEFKHLALLPLNLIDILNSITIFLSIPCIRIRLYWTDPIDTHRTSQGGDHYYHHKDDSHGIYDTSKVSLSKLFYMHNRLNLLWEQHTRLRFSFIFRWIHDLVQYFSLIFFLSHA